MTNKLILLAIVFGIIWIIFNEFTGTRRYVHETILEILGV